MATIYSIKKIISIIKSELKDFYPANEIDSFTYLLFENVLGYSRTKLLISQDEEITEQDSLKINQIIADLKMYKPIQLILGETEFYNLKFKVFEHVLIPRPETEELVDWIIKSHLNEQKKILDIGTGSGCIAISLAKNLPYATVYASDISTSALKAAQYNSSLNKVDIHVLSFDILSPDIVLNNQFDIIVSNPPYITEREKVLMHKNVLGYEPELALFVSDNDPLVFYGAVLNFALKHLNAGGEVYFEINESFGRETVLLMKEKGFSEVLLKKDINGKDRMVKGKLKK